MGVAGCGKSSLGAAVAAATGLVLVEGDDFHSPASRAKMSQGIALTDADRDGWLGVLGEQLHTHPQGLVLTCSALKLAYRERLRQAAPGLRFVFLDISREQSQARVSARAQQHFFSTTLVDSQFAALDGIKLRVMQNNVFLNSFKTLGANAIPMAFSELFGALETKTVDGQENPYNTILSSKSKGMLVNELSPAEAERMRAKLTGVYADISKEVGPDLWNETQKELTRIRAAK